MLAFYHASFNKSKKKNDAAGTVSQETAVLYKPGK